ncbi:glycoside hydrolase family 13 protein [Sporolactobacillus spathodeae]|uniref:Glycosidase n=1 Tax=Sporolactobacillus spathodeae TaxID=1465502 RepID=A0ABS2Q8W5_9BACL|nr:glycoside hydrolase family 13 protein [Sporolactobacillus spathodeae]MBM7658183.1 glycosidase [Sporolactobacillus spathodeae]
MAPDSAYFNSWSEAYRRPFGAIQIGKSIFMAIDVRFAHVLRVELAIQKDGSGFEYVEMFQDGEDPIKYRIKYVTEGASGLYFYHFRITCQTDSGTRLYYYGKQADHCGGAGQLLDDPGAVSQYQLTCYAYSDPAPEWYTHGIIYHIFIDRFNNGNAFHRISNPKKNSFIYATEDDDPYYIRDSKGHIVRWDFFGGNLKGIIDKLHELHQFGVTILYLSPIFEASSNHRYNTADFTKIDPMIGDRPIFEKLIKKAKRLNIRIILDGVFNHVGADSVYFNRFGTYGNGGAYNDTRSAYYNWFTFHHYPDSYDSWWAVDDLPTVKKDLPAYRHFIFDSDQSIVSQWTEAGIGGWRLDVADELPDDFIAGIRRAVDRHSNGNDRKVLIGEVWEDASNKIAYGKRRHYLEGGMLHGAMNYPVRHLIIDLIEQRISARSAARQLLTLKSNYPPEAFNAAMNNIGSHDTERILTVFNGNEEKLKLAIWLLMTLPGVPCIYYGDEAGLTGGKDPENRRFYPWGRENQRIKQIYYQAAQARRHDLNLQSGDFLPFSIGDLFGFVRFRSQEYWTMLLLNPTSIEQPVHWDERFDETGGSRLLEAMRLFLPVGLSLAPCSLRVICNNS